MMPVPYGYCKCGCGQKTSIPKINNKSCGYSVGVPMQYVSGHNVKGKKLSAYTKNKLRLQKLGDRNPMYGKKMSEKNKQALLKSNKNNKWMCGKKLSSETREKMSISRKGEKHWNWMGGVSFAPYTTEWTRTLKRSIRERDKYACRVCGELQGDIAFHVHHIDYDKKNCNPDNLVTLCISCHMKTNNNRGHWIVRLQNNLQEMCGN